jgi:hypothetical protein
MTQNLGTEQSLCCVTRVILGCQQDFSVWSVMDVQLYTGANTYPNKKCHEQKVKNYLSSSRGDIEYRNRPYFGHRP